MPLRAPRLRSGAPAVTVAADIRARLTSVLHLRLGHAGAPVSLTVAASIAADTMRAANIEAMTGYIDAVEQGGDLTQWRERLGGNPATSRLLLP